MTAAEAKRIIHPETTVEALAEIKDKNAKVAAVDDACLVACAALDKQIPKKPRETRCALMCANCGHKITEKGCKKLHRTTAKNAVSGFYGRMNNGRRRQRR